MIDKLLQSRLSELKSEAEQRALVQRVMTVIGHMDPPKIVKCSWEGMANSTLYVWGEVALVSGLLLPLAEVGEDGPGKLRRLLPVEKPKPRPKHDPIFDNLTPKQKETFQKIRESLKDVFDHTPTLTIRDLPEDEKKEILRVIHEALHPGEMSDEDVRESLEALQRGEDIDFPEGL